jgi:hypothetical protein
LPTGRYGESRMLGASYSSKLTQQHFFLGIVADVIIKNKHFTTASSPTRSSCQLLGVPTEFVA